LTGLWSISLGTRNLKTAASETLQAAKGGRVRNSSEKSDIQRYKKWPTRQWARKLLMNLTSLKIEKELRIKRGRTNHPKVGRGGGATLSL